MTRIRLLAVFALIAVAVFICSTLLLATLLFANTLLIYYIEKKLEEDSIKNGTWA